jgi:hypothetical protein
MCGFCGARTAPNDVATAARLAAAANATFAPLGVTVRSWSGRFIVANATGRSVIVDRPADVDAAAVRLARRVPS